MAKKQNPYHLWLGLPSAVVSPDYFQLLEIVPGCSDDQQIAAAARARAQQLLDRLKNVKVRNESEKAVLEKLKARILTAHKTIADPAKRKRYAAALAAKTSRGPTPPETAPTTPGANQAETPQVIPPQAIPPQAIPLAMPIQDTPPPPAVVPDQNDMFSGIDVDDTVKVRPVRARARRSSMVPIVVTLLIITIIGGLVSLLAKYNNMFDVLANRRQSPTTSTATVTTDSMAGSASEPLRVPESFGALVASQTRSDDANELKATDEVAGWARQEEANALAAEPSEPGDLSVEMSEDGSATKMSDGTEVSEGEQASSDASRAAAASFSVARVATNLVRAALMRRDVRAAKIANQRIERIVDAKRLTPAANATLQDEFEQNDQMTRHTDSFLAQVRSSADELPGGQEIKVGKLVMALIDSSPTEVTLRRAGRNDVIPYMDLPSSVAIALGDQGSKKSVPQWNMAKAADLTIQSRFNPTLQEQAAPFLSQSISDGYDVECGAIVAYGLMDWQQQHLPADRAADLKEDQIRDLLRDFRAANGYKNPKLVKSDAAAEILRQLLFVPAQSQQHRMARLADAIAIAAGQKQFDVVLVAAEELYRLSNPHHVVQTVVTPMSRAMRVDMTSAQSRHYVHTVINMVKQFKSRGRFQGEAKPKLLRHARTLVEEFEFSELEPELKMLNGG